VQHAMHKIPLYANKTATIFASFMDQQQITTKCGQEKNGFYDQKAAHKTVRHTMHHKVRREGGLFFR